MVLYLPLIIDGATVHNDKFFSQFRLITWIIKTKVETQKVYGQQ